MAYSKAVVIKHFLVSDQCALQVLLISGVGKRDISTSGKKDTVIMWGGTNDSQNEANIGLMHARKFVNSRQNMNITIVTGRDDLQVTSCVNKEVETFNRQLHKMMKIAYHVRIIQANLRRNDFTLHRLHLSFPGKKRWLN
jgi:hypothetical protein